MCSFSMRVKSWYAVFRFFLDGTHYAVLKGSVRIIAMLFKIMIYRTQTSIFYFKKVRFSLRHPTNVTNKVK